MDRGEPLRTRGMLPAGKARPACALLGRLDHVPVCLDRHVAGSELSCERPLWHRASFRLKEAQAVLLCSSSHTVLQAALDVSRHMCTHGGRWAGQQTVPKFLH